MVDKKGLLEDPRTKLLIQTAARLLAGDLAGTGESMRYFCDDDFTLDEDAVLDDAVKLINAAAERVARHDGKKGTTERKAR